MARDHLEWEECKILAYPGNLCKDFTAWGGPIQDFNLSGWNEAKDLQEFA
jgi:environmental stress-induced protein Ves